MVALRHPRAGAFSIALLPRRAILFLFSSARTFAIRFRLDSPPPPSGPTIAIPMPATAEWLFHKKSHPARGWKRQVNCRTAQGIAIFIETLAPRSTSIKRKGTSLGAYLCLRRRLSNLLSNFLRMAAFHPARFGAMFEAASLDGREMRGPSLLRSPRSVFWGPRMPPRKWGSTPLAVCGSSHESVRRRILCLGLRARWLIR